MLELGPPEVDPPMGEDESRLGLPNDDAGLSGPPATDVRWPRCRAPLPVGTTNGGPLHLEDALDLDMGWSLCRPYLVADSC